MGKQFMRSADPMGHFREDIPTDNMGRPVTPDYFGSDGMLKDQYQLSSGDDWSRLAKERLGTDIAGARNEATLSGAGAAQQARNALASRGGLSGGSAALLARQAMTDQSNAQQGITNTGVRGAQDIGMKQFDIGREAEKYNKGTALGLKQSTYDTQMKEWGASKSADAQAEAQNRKGILGK